MICSSSVPRRALSTVAIALVIGCEGMGPQRAVRIRTEASAYTLQHTASSFYEVVIPVEITNLREETVYLPVGCGKAYPVRPQGVVADLDLQSPGHVQAEPCHPEPMAIASGETYTDSVLLFGSLNSMGSSTMADLTGSVQLVYPLRSESWESGQSTSAPALPEEERLSNVFRIDPPGGVSYLEPYER